MIPKTRLIPGLYDTLMSLKREIFLDFNCVKPGKINSYNPATRTARVEIGMTQRMADTSIVTYPILYDLPVITIQGGGVGVQFPINTGDECLAIFSDRNIDTWFESGSASPQPPPSGRLHDINDGFVLVGVNSLAKVLTLALLTGEGGVATSQAKVAVNSTTHKITVANQTHNLFTNLSNLNTTLNNLITVLNALTTVGGPTNQAISPASIAALVPITTQLTAIQTDLAGLLY